MKILGIIPARGGSKGVPGKNTIKIDGKYLMSYAIEAGKKSTVVDQLVVSTEDFTIAKIATANDCRVIYRSEKLASDTSNVVDAVLEVIQKLEQEHDYYDAVILLQPTAPLRTGKDLDNAVQLFKDNIVDAVISMVPVGDHHPARMYEIKEGQLNNAMPRFETERRQDLPELFIRNGCIYLVSIDALKRERSFMPVSKIAYVMDAYWAVNIDAPLDVVVLKSLMKEWNKILK